MTYPASRLHTSSEMSLFADRFDIIKLLGRGGMAEVWLAEQKGIRGFARRVVIKQMLSHLAEDREFVRRFEDEARVAALMKHSNVVRVEDFGEASGAHIHMPHDWQSAVS